MMKEHRGLAALTPQSSRPKTVQRIFDEIKREQLKTLLVVNFSNLHTSTSLELDFGSFEIATLRSRSREARSERERKNRGFRGHESHTTKMNSLHIFMNSAWMPYQKRDKGFHNSRVNNQV